MLSKKKVQLLQYQSLLWQFHLCGLLTFVIKHQKNCVYFLFSLLHAVNLQLRLRLLLFG